MNNIQIAMQALNDNNYTIAVVKNEEVIYFSFDRGIKPLYSLIKTQKNILESASVADKVVGLAAAMFYVDAGIRELSTDIISEKSLQLLQDHNIVCYYCKLVPNIQNFDKTSLCPIERLALSSANVDDLANAIEGFFKAVSQKQGVKN